MVNRCTGSHWIVAASVTTTSELWQGFWVSIFIWLCLGTLGVFDISFFFLLTVLEPLFCHLLQMLIDQLQEARLSWPDIKMPILQRIFLYANSMVQSLNSASSAAHIYGVGIKAIPSIWFQIRNNTSSFDWFLLHWFAVHITPGFLPKSLHTLNLSRNKISTIEGLRELTRLRVLDLSYNRISRIGQG